MVPVTTSSGESITYSAMPGPHMVNVAYAAPSQLVATTSDGMYMYCVLILAV